MTSLKQRENFPKLVDKPPHSENPEHFAEVSWVARISGKGIADHILREIIDYSLVATLAFSLIINQPQDLSDPSLLKRYKEHEVVSKVGSKLKYQFPASTYNSKANNRW